MSRILLCWEMGLNQGHVKRLARLAVQFEALGHHTAFCLKQTDTARAQLPDTAIIRQAPLPDRQYCRDEDMYNYVDILRHHGYVHERVITDLLSQWFDVFDDIKPDLVIGDHSPTAMLAARCRGLAAAAIGNGFTLPPRQSPMPLARWWLPTPPRALLRQREREVLGNINANLKHFDSEPLTRAADILDTQVRGLLTMPALDEYPERPDDEVYRGDIAHPGDGAWPGWPNDTHPRVLGYLRGVYDSLKPILLALNNSPVSALVYVPDVQMNGPLLQVPERVTLSAEPLDIQRGAHECDAAVSYAGTGFVTDLLAQGKPLLLAPQYTQQAMLAQRVVSAGAGLLGQDGWTREHYIPLVRQLVSDPELTRNARSMAQTINTYPRGEAVSQGLVEDCVAFLR